MRFNYAVSISRFQSHGLNLTVSISRSQSHCQLSASSPILGMRLSMNGNSLVMIGQFLKLTAVTTLAIGSCSIPGFMQSAIAAPTTTTTVITDLDAALNRKDATAVTNLLSPNYSHSDGYTRQDLTQSLQALWKQYPTLTYRTEVIKTENSQVETLTTIQGKRNLRGQLWKIEGTIRALQVIETNQVRSQTILAEETQVHIGEKPPTVTISLPPTVSIGSDYSYDVVIQEPMNDDLFMGTIFDEPVSPALMSNPTQLEIQFPSLAELLTGRPSRRPPKTPSATPVKSVKLSRMKSGGFFKIGRASNVPETKWISAILARHDGGITIATTRLRIVK
jgi:hypothetical protein